MSDKSTREQTDGQAGGDSNVNNQENVAQPELESELESEQPQLETDISALQQQLTEEQAKSKDNWEQLLRAKAEIENVRRRSTIEVEKAIKYSSERFAKELLDVVDSLEKGLENTTEDNEKTRVIYDGMSLTYKLLIDTLDKHGIKMIDPQGESFDPSKHEALAMQESPDSKPNSILTVVQRGFTIHERVLRPARVIVAKANSQQPGSSVIDEKA